MKRFLIILVAIALIVLISWGHIAIWHNWTWVYYIPGSAWIGTIIYAIAIGLIGLIATSGSVTGIVYTNAVVVVLICIFTQYFAFSPSFLADGGWDDWVFTILIMLFGAMISGSIASGHGKDLFEAWANS